MAHFEREQNGEPQSLGDLPAVRAMVASGALKGSDRVRVDGQAWVLAKELPQLKSLFVPSPDLWSAWDEEDLAAEVTTPAPESAGAGAEKPFALDPPAPPKPLPPPASIPPATTSPAPPPPEQPVLGGATGAPEEVLETHVLSAAAALGPDELPEEALAPMPPSVGKVIAFPGPKRTPVRPRSSASRGSPALRYETTPLLVHEGLEPLAPVLEKTEEKLPGRFQTRHYWMIASILLTCMLTLLMVVWVRGTASWTSDAPLGPMVAQPELPVLPEPVAVVVDPEANPAVPEPALSEVVAELRARIPQDARPLGLDPSAMEDVLFVELRRVVALDRVQIKVLEFDVANRPSSLELKVVLQEEGAVDLSRSFAAIGLVVGKYVDREGLNLPVVKVLLPTEEGTLEKAFVGDRAAAFWRGELGAQAYLRGE